MATKFDKDALKKHLFWILLGVFVIFWVVGVSIAVLPGDDKAAKEYEAAKKVVDTTKGKSIKTPAYQDPWKAHGLKFRSHKDVIWEKAWKQQADMYTWPDSMLAVTPRPFYPEDPFIRDAAGNKNVTEDVKIRNRFPEWYREQFVDLERLVYPAKFNGGLEAVFPEQKFKSGSAPTQEEIWLAQEDFWVKRELLYLIRQAMDATALFHEVPAPKDQAPPEGALAKRVFRNANWELTLVIENAPKGKGFVISERSTIKNINIDERTQVLANSEATLGLPFRFSQGTSAFKDIRISGEPLPFGKEAPVYASKDGAKLSVAPVYLNDPMKPFNIEQILDWEISPVRRVDMIALARHSHRTVVGNLKANPELKALDKVDSAETTEPAPSGGTTPPGGATNMPGGSGGGSGGGPPPGTMQTGNSGATGGGDKGSAADLTTVNAIPRDRYLHVTPQCRHLPVVIRLVVDQAHIHDILSSISNSRLRMQITQVSFHHVRGVTRGTQAEAPAAAGNTTAGGIPGGTKLPGNNPPGGGQAGSRSMSGSTSAGTAMPGMPGASSFGAPVGGGGRVLFGGPSDASGGATLPKGVAGTSTARVLDNARLVELSIYALASLYERFPARPKATTTPGTTPASK